MVHNRMPPGRPLWWLLALLLICWRRRRRPRPRFARSARSGRSRPEVITEVYRDRQGFLWIGTREGLFLHDGQRFRKFQHELNAPDSISDSGVRGVFEDSRGRLWIHTISGGLNLLDRARWSFRRFRHQEGAAR